VTAGDLVPDGLYYTNEHEWTRLEGEREAVVGITDYAQKLLGDVVFLSLPKIGERLTQFAKCGEIESPKAVSDLFTPLGGEVVAVNEEVVMHPELANRDPYGQGWLFRLAISDAREWDRLMTAEAYRALVAPPES
jgi:glycine cleavage system H protein